MKKPLIYMSRCFGFEKCRYDGEMVSDEFIESLKSRADIIHECPEMAIGLGCPRSKIWVIKKDGKYELFQPDTGSYLAEKMRNFAKSYVEKLENVDAFILKAKSPSCGVGNAKLYDPDKNLIINETETGFFAAEIIKRFPNALIIDELRLAIPQEREFFLKRVFNLPQT